MKLPSSFAILLASILLGTVPARAQCSEWVPNFVTLSGGVDDQVRAQVVFDDGSGPALYLGGYFGHTSHGNLDPGAFQARLARWNGSRFEVPSGGSPNAAVLALCVFDDGSGPALYAGGIFTMVGSTPANHVARWNGTAWSALGAGFDSDVLALCVYDDGSGPALYAGGAFGNSGGTPMPGLARWNGSSWASLGSGVAGAVLALCVVDDGGGAKLYAGGSFGSVDGTLVSNVASFNGTSWSALGSGTNEVVLALAAHDAGSGPALYAAGLFTSAGGTSAQRIARWTGSAWSALGSGIDADVYTLHSYDDGSGPKLAAGGTFSHAGGSPASAIAAWDGANWSSLSSSTNGTVFMLGVYDEGDGPKLYTGGQFTAIGGHNADHVARLVNSDWKPIGAGQPPSGAVLALSKFDLGDGPKLYVGGAFTKVGVVDANGIARWNGTSWSGLGAGVNGSVSALAIFDDGSGPVLCVGGNFTTAGGNSANGVARWNGTSWSSFGAGLSGGTVESLAAFDDGSGPALYAGGAHFSVGGVPCIVKWNGTAWQAVGGALTYYGNPPQVEALKVWDDGTGPALYAAGAFDTIAGVTVNHMAKWNGSTWSALGSGASGGFVFALETYNDGSGSKLYAAGYPSSFGGLATGNVARWNGTSWSSLTPTSVINNTVYALHAFDEGNGPVLYAGSTAFYMGTTYTNLARWDGAAWSSLGANGQDVHALASYDEGSGQGLDLYVGRQYPSGGYYNPQFLSQWRSCPPSITTFCYGDGGQVACPCANSGAVGSGCDNSLFLGGAHLTGVGSTQPDNVVMTTNGLAQTALTVFLQGTTNLWPGVHFGDGLRCVGGTLKRIYTKAAVGGVVVVPGPGDPSITARSASLGFPILPGAELYYQTRYRDPNPNFCPEPQGNTWNASNGAVIRW